MEENSNVKPTSLLWLVPVFMGLLGGILLYIAVKDEDQRKANYAMVAGTFSTILMILIYLLIIVIPMNSYRNMTLLGFLAIIIGGSWGIHYVGRKFKAIRKKNKAKRYPDSL